MITKPTYIYALICPEIGQVRYIGKTNGLPKDRLTHHLRGYSSDKSYAKKNWVKSLLKKGLYPVMSIVEKCGDDWKEKEKYWISYFRNNGDSLLNIADGGQTISYWTGKKRSQETKDKISKANKGRECTEETRKKLSEALKNADHSWRVGREHSEEHKQKISAANKGRKKPPRTKEHAAKIAAANRGRIPWNKGKETSEGTKAKMRKPHNISDEQRQKMSDRMLGKEPPNKGKKTSLAVRKKQSEAHLKNPTRYWAGKHHSEETKKKISETLKGKHGLA